MDVRGREAVVTGGVKGLGRAVVEALAARGASITVLDLDAEGLERLAQEMPGVSTLQCDVSDERQVDEALAKFHARVRAAHILVNNAGIIHSAPLVRMGPAGIERYPTEMWNKVLASNLTSVFLVGSRIVERMVATRTRGVVVNISSISAVGNPGQTAYSAAKAGVESMTAAWSRELGIFGIRALAVAPGFVGTDSTRAALSESTIDDIVARVPLRRLAKPEEISSAVLFGIENDFVNGKTISVDGGLAL